LSDDEIGFNILLTFMEDFMERTCQSCGREDFLVGVGDVLLCQTCRAYYKSSEHSPDMGGGGVHEWLADVFIPQHGDRIVLDSFKSLDEIELETYREIDLAISKS